MKWTTLIFFLFSCHLFAESEIKITDSYQEIQKIIELNKNLFSQEDLLVVFDLDDTVLRSLDCPERNKNLTGFLKFEDQVRKCGAQLTSPHVPKIIESLQSEDYSVMALTARRDKIIEGTLKQLNDKLILSEDIPESRNIDFVTAPFYSEKTKSIKFDQPGKKNVLKKKLFFKNGVAFASGANKGLALQAYLKHIKRHYNFKRIVFIDDNPRNIKNLDKAYQSASESMLIIHYTEFNDH